MNKIKKFLIILFCILAFAYFILNSYTKELENMASKVGYKLGGGELSMNEYYTLLQYFDTYKEYIEKKEYKKAYNMLGASYRNYISYAEYEDNITKKEMSKSEVEDINIITATTFDLIYNISGEKEHYSIIIDKELDIPKLYPDSFLDYRTVEINQKNKKINCLLKDYVVNIDKTTLNFELENRNNDKIYIKEAILYTNLDDVINLNEEVTIEAKEQKNISLSFDTEYAFPTKIVLKCNIGDNTKEIEFVFEINN